MAADAVIMAVPHEAAARLLPAQALPDPLPWPELDASPIVNVHVVYDREVMREPFAAAVGSSVQWVFDRTAVSGLRRGQYLAVSLSAADRWVDMPTAELRARFVPELRRLLPAARDADVRDLFVTRERRATFRQRPGTAGARPGAATRARACSSPARGPTRAGPTPWRAQCAAASRPPAWSAATWRG